MSLSSLFDITQPTDCLRVAPNMLTEYEQAKEDSDVRCGHALASNVLTVCHVSYFGTFP